MPNLLQIQPVLQRVLPLLLLGLLLGAVGLLYSLALPGYALFDEWFSLDGLKSIQDWPSTLVYILSGQTGPLGRPLALATFAMQAWAWPDQPGALLQTNFVLHLLATGCCFAFATGLARLHLPDSTSSPLWIGLGTAALWGLSPFLATTHLMIIQRMSSLAGLWVFAGLAAFVWAHLIDKKKVWQRRCLLITGLGGATILGALSKENGALLPLLALIILWLWIPREQWLRASVDRALLVFLVLLPSLMLLAYLASRLPETLANGYGPYRYFTPGERLMSQPAILLDYLHNLLFPRAFSVSPFMDQLPAPSGWLDPPITLIAALFWPILLGITIALRRIAPYFLFGLAFFLTGHILESGFIGLELYFAHRNYVPAFGLYFGLVFAIATTVPAQFSRFAIMGLTAYVMLFALVLFQVTSTWNNTAVNAELWLKKNPHSQRGAQFLSMQYSKRGDFAGARRILDEAAKRHPTLPLLQIQRTGNCVGRETEFPQLLKEVTDALRTASFQPLAALELAKFAHDEKSADLCPLRNHAALEAMANALLDNPFYADRTIPRSLLFLAKAFARTETNDIPQAIEFFVESFQTNPDLEIAFYGASLMANSGQYSRVYAFLQEVRKKAPHSNLQRALWLKRLDDYLEVIKESERKDAEAKAAETHGSG